MLKADSLEGKSEEYFMYADNATGSDALDAVRLKLKRLSNLHGGP
jgi:hypothetical protein